MEALTFLEIFKDGKFTNIEIPIIQRDYAQGRLDKEVTRIRQRFLSVLYDALTGVSKPIKLDFIYGNITDGKLIPLDGQQRLTTLFLLHWYIAKKERRSTSDYDVLYRFTYRTRFSSQHFCQSLLSSMPDFEGGALSQWIKDQNWFMYSWEKDPTITSMLTMLDDIHRYFKNSSGIWDELKNKKIGFYFLPLEQMGLTDSLYIKMNSRGKPLTLFEHFKADFEKIIKPVSHKLYEEFIHKIDVTWADMLWKYRGDDNLTDDEFMRYYRFVTELICYSKGLPVIHDDFDLATEVYSIKNPDAESNLTYLFRSLDCWQQLNSIDGFFLKYFATNNYEPDKVCIYSDDTNLFRQCCHNYGIMIGNRRKFTYNNTLLLSAVLDYLHNKDNLSEQDFVERIRIVRNLVFNSEFEIRETRLKALLEDVHEVMVNKVINLNTLGLNEIQKNEELLKIKWRQENPEKIKLLNRFEDHYLLQGSVAIINLDNVAEFEKRTSKFALLFNGNISYTLISKAMLSIKDYSQLSSWRFLFGNENNSTWRELFTPSQQRKNFESTSEVLCQLLDILPDSDLKEFLDHQVSNYLSNTATVKDWRYYFIKYPSMRKGNSGVYWWRNDPRKVKGNQYEIIMMNTAVTLNGKHWDPFLFTLYNDEDLAGKCTLGEYNDPLIINSTLEEIRCTNNTWKIHNPLTGNMYSIEIPQNEGHDMHDRLELLKYELSKN